MVRRDGRRGEGWREERGKMREGGETEERGM